jgi:hypothetical protein
MNAQGPSTPGRRYLGTHAVLAALVVLALAACGGSSSGGKHPTTTTKATAKTCSTATLTTTIKASRQLSGTAPRDYTVANIRTAASDPSWAAFQIDSTLGADAAGNSNNFKHISGIGRCHGGSWTVTIGGVVGGVAGCTAVPSPIRAQLSLQTDAECSIKGLADTSQIASDPIAKQSFASPSAIANFLAGKGITCSSYQDNTPELSSVEGQCDSNGSSITMSIFSDTAHRDTWVNYQRAQNEPSNSQLISAKCISDPANATTTFILGANWALQVNPLFTGPSGDPLTNQIATAIGTTPDKLC